MTVKVDGILQVRMKSSRLPGKVMMPVLGRPLLGLMAERITAAKTLDRFVVATSAEKEDDPVEAFCRREGIEIFRGSEEDVLDRLYQCARHYGMQHIARFCGDNPLIDPAVTDKVVGFYLENLGRFDYVSNNHPPTWPDGQEVEVMPFAVLEAAWRNSDKPFQREHGTPYIWDQPEKFRIGNVQSDEYLYSENRWTLDYREDFEFVREVFERLYPSKRIFTVKDVLDLVRADPSLAGINAMHRGYTWYKKEKDNLKTVRLDG